ncbi:MAG TPA: DUF305 domain-containing protein [Polyangiaceae bacterium]
MKRRSLLLLGVWALALGCGTSAPSASAAQSAPEGCDTGAVAPAQLVVDGHYADARFVDMMSAHHAVAIRMAQDEAERGKRPELVQLARGIITSQGAEIDKMRQLKQQECGTSQVTLRVNPIEDENSGMADQLPAQNVDLAFIDSMIPHHAGAIRMAGVARLRSQDKTILDMARGIIDAQAREIGEMIAWRHQWFGDAS